jgi:DEAD/DEAH box helicase
MDSSTSRPSRRPAFSSRPRSGGSSTGGARRFSSNTSRGESASGGRSSERRSYAAPSGDRSGGGRSFSSPAQRSGRRPFSSGSGRGSSARAGGRGGRKMQTFDVSKYINLNPVDTSATEEVYKATHTFKTFGLEQPLVTTITNMGLTIPSPIQDQIIPHILDGRDVVGLAQTGTGKTAAFLIPTINKTLKQYNRQTLILAPTRELAIQVEQELKR